MTIDSNRSLGGLGAILTLVGVIGIPLALIRYTNYSSTTSLADLGILGVSTITSILAFVGFILFMVAMHGFSKDYGERRIFSYLIYGFIATLVIVVLLAISWLALTVSSVFASLRNMSIASQLTSAVIQSMIAPYLAPLLLAISIGTLVWIVANYKAFNLLADKSQEQHFRTTAKLFLLGASINIIIAATVTVIAYFGAVDYNTMLIVALPGSAIEYVGWVFAAKGFYSIEPPSETYTPLTYAPPAQPSKFCPHCGAQNQPDSDYCQQCGQKMV